jgi:stage II sporulation protein GA (sporulation sigma-E factor processing peptidase)
MEQTVYADLLFLVNFSMDFLCFYITSAILHKKLSVLRSFFASVAGGVYSVAILFAYLVPPFGLICDAGACTLMCTFVFFGKRKRMSEILLSFAVYIGTSAVLGGMMTALFNLLNSMELPFELLEVESEGIPVWLFALLAAASGAATLAGGRFFRERQSQRSAEVEIFFDGKSAKMYAVCDNGNFVRDPISGKCVVVGDLASLRRILPNEIVKAVRSGDAAHLADLPPDIGKRLRLIPTSSVGGTSMLFALVPDKIVVFGEDGKSHESSALFAAAPIGNTANGFEALLPPELLV